MKWFFSSFAVLLLLLSCQKESNEVVVEEVVATDIMISKREIFLKIGEDQTLGAVLSPAKATDRTLIWSSTDTGVATVKDGLVSSVAPGSAEIIVQHGNLTDKCRVTVYTVPDGAVPIDIMCTRMDDKGNAIKDEHGNEIHYIIHFADRNLGASAPEDYGDYYAWGETETYYVKLDPLTWKEGKSSGFSEEAYNGARHLGDGQTLPLEDDVANAILGGKWRIPTPNEFTCLASQSKWEAGTKNGIPGYYAFSKDENNKNSIFFPSGGSIYGRSRFDFGLRVENWTSFTKKDNNNNNAICSLISEDDLDIYKSGHSVFGSLLRYNGRTIRPVTE